ncbi:MAG TPA: DUF1876 domain-containing protein [Micromonosporaceae bacterium]|nr:DUF1876 domain-containing protein [Micromonosporaceae bacterium]
MPYALFSVLPPAAQAGHEGRPTMRVINRWAVDVTIGESDGYTYAEAELHDDIGNHLVGAGRARLNPADRDVPEIGDEIAVARALNALGRGLLETAAEDIESITREPVRLSH